MIYSTIEAEKELERRIKQFRNIITARAILFAEKEGTQTITPFHIKNACRKKIHEASNKEKIILLVSTVLLAGFAFFQLSVEHSKIHLCLLPLFSLFWVGIVITTLRDYL